MKYAIKSVTRYDSGDSTKTHVSYFQGVDRFMSLPHFGKIEGAKTFNTKKEARQQLHDIGRREGDKYKIVKAQSVIHKHT